MKKQFKKLGFGYTEGSDFVAIKIHDTKSVHFVLMSNNTLIFDAFTYMNNRQYHSIIIKTRATKNRITVLAELLDIVNAKW